jgi:uncharacterized protein
VFTLSTLIITAVAALLAGGAIGAILVKSLHPQEQQNRDMEHRLESAENKLSDYQQEVSEHFAETSQLVNNLTQSYKDVHEHLANSALTLTNPDISRQLIEAGDGKLINSDTSGDKKDDTDTEAPRDWAPKNPGETGQLSEEFGLDKNQEATKEAS